MFETSFLNAFKIYFVFFHLMEQIAQKLGL